MNWKEKHKRFGMIQIAAMAIWAVTCFIGAGLHKPAGPVLMIGATVFFLGFMFWVIRDARKIDPAKDRGLHRGPDPFLSTGRRHRNFC
jgi:hypothetical protein